MKTIRKNLAKFQLRKINSQIQKTKMKHPALKTEPNTPPETNANIIRKFYNKLNELAGKILLTIDENTEMRLTNQIKFYMF